MNREVVASGGTRDTSAPSGNGAGGFRDADLLVIGSGGAAFAAAIRARELGKRVVMVEHATTGGTCVNVGCIPSKSLLVSAKQAGGDAARLATAVERKGQLVDQLRQEKYVDLIDAYGIDFRHGIARLVDAHTVAIDDEPVTADAILIAAGAHPAAPPIPGLNEAGYLTSTSALELTEPPQRLAVLGAGSVGLELGQMFGLFGSSRSSRGARFFRRPNPKSRRQFARCLKPRAARS